VSATEPPVSVSLPPAPLICTLWPEAQLVKTTPDRSAVPPDTALTTSVWLSSPASEPPVTAVVVASWSLRKVETTLIGASKTSASMSSTLPVEKSLMPPPPPPVNTSVSLPDPPSTVSPLSNSAPP